jgi:hypothetical protein
MDYKIDRPHKQIEDHLWITLQGILLNQIENQLSDDLRIELRKVIWDQGDQFRLMFIAVRTSIEGDFYGR